MEMVTFNFIHYQNSNNITWDVFDPRMIFRMVYMQITDQNKVISSKEIQF